jgi:hypothetical protein
MSTPRGERKLIYAKTACENVQYTYNHYNHILRMYHRNFHIKIKKMVMKNKKRTNSTREKKIKIAYEIPGRYTIFFCNSTVGEVGGCSPYVKYGVRSPKLIWAPLYMYLYSLAKTPNPTFTPSPRIWAHIRGRYWSAKMDDISL